MNGFLEQQEGHQQEAQTDNDNRLLRVVAVMLNQ
jgi:hypothetical protein